MLYSSSSADEHYQVLHALLPETSLHSTERIRGSYFSHDDFLAARSAAMIIESEGVMQDASIRDHCPKASLARVESRVESRTQRGSATASQIRSLQRQCCCYKRQLGTRVLNTEKETLPCEAQSLLINCGQTLRGCGVHRLRRPIQPRAIRGTRGSAQTTEARSQIIRRANPGPSICFPVDPKIMAREAFTSKLMSKSGEIFVVFHLGSLQDVFWAKKTRPCLFCLCPATCCEVAISASTFLGNCVVRPRMMHALRNCRKVQPR